MKNLLSTTLASTVAAATLAFGLSAPNAAHAQQTLGELRSVGFNYCPRAWAQAAGQILPINQNQALYSLLGTTYGGDGRTTFALPDLRGRVAINHGTSTAGGSYNWGQKSGQEAVTLTVAQLPNHTHTARALNSDGTATSPSGAAFAIGKNLIGSEIAVYSSAANNGTLNAAAMANAGGGQGHENRMPYLATRWCIALNGIFPSRN